MRVHLAREMTQSGAGWQPQGLHTETVSHGASVPWVNREHHDPHRDVQQRSLEQDATVRKELYLHLSPGRHLPLSLQHSSGDDRHGKSDLTRRGQVGDIRVATPLDDNSTIQPGSS